MRGILPGWTPPPDMLVLEQPHIHVWRFTLDPGEDEQGRFLSLLSTVEVRRLAQFRFARDRRRFVAAHGMVRALLSLYTAEDPALLRFVRNRYGKPELVRSHNRIPPAFNLAHSGGTGILAVGRQNNLGVDLERLRDDIDPLVIAGDFFSAGEVHDLRGVAPGGQQQAFFRCWTRKEAFIKGKGKGLSIPLDAFRVSLRADDGDALLMSRVDARDLQRWSIIDLDPGEGLAAALAVDSRHFLVHRWEAPPSYILRLVDQRDRQRRVRHHHSDHHPQQV